MDPIVSGQLYYNEMNQCEGGAMFWIGHHNKELYYAKLLSPLTANVVEEKNNFTTLGEAMEWCYSHGWDCY